MDDFGKSVSSAEQAIEIYELLLAMMAKGGLELTKWVSNCEKTLTIIDQADSHLPLVKRLKQSRLLHPSGAAVERCCR